MDPVIRVRPCLVNMVDPRVPEGNKGPPDDSLVRLQVFNSISSRINEMVGLEDPCYCPAKISTGSLKF
eukprot:768185-Hanusia_phi.AAC.1